MMNLTIVGTGYVGLVTGVCFAEFGYSVTCIDKDTERLEELKSGTCPFFEPGMDKLLDKHINKTKLIKIKFLYPHSANNRIIAELLQNMWKDNLGIDVEIRGLEWRVYLMQLDSNRPNIFRAGWAADYPDPHNFMNLFTCNIHNIQGCVYVVGIYQNFNVCC